MIGQFTPSMRAVGNIRPFRFVAPDTTEDNSCAEAADNAEIVVGVSQGDNKEFDNANHAEDGDICRLQPGLVVRVEAGAAITTGARIAPIAGGLADNIAAVTEVEHGIALEAAADAGEIIRIFLQTVRRPAV